jgi:hypothetical protein
MLMMLSLAGICAVLASLAIGCATAIFFMTSLLAPASPVHVASPCIDDDDDKQRRKGFSSALSSSSLHLKLIRIRGEGGRNTLALATFCASMSVSILLFALLLAEIISLLAHDELVLLWSIALFSIKALSSVIIPALFFYTALIGSSSPTITRKTFAVSISTLFTVAIYYTLFNSCGVIARLAAAGVVTSSILSGFSSVNFPFECFRGFLLPPPSHRDIDDLESRVLQSQAFVNTKQRKLDDLMNQETTNIHDNSTSSSSPKNRFGTSSSSSSSGFLKSFTTLFGGSDSSAADTERIRGRMEREIETLDYIVIDMKRELQELIERQSDFAKKSPLRRILGAFFSIVLVIRVYLSVRAFLASSPIPQSDSITPIIAFIGYSVGGNDIDMDLGGAGLAEANNSMDFVSIKVFSFAITFLLSVSQVQGFLSMISRLSNNSSSSSREQNSSSINNPSKVASSASLFRLSLASKVLLLSFITLAFFVASVVMLHTQLPPEYVSVIDVSLGDCKYGLLFTSQNVLYIVTSLATVAALVVVNRIKKSQSANSILPR